MNICKEKDTKQVEYVFTLTLPQNMKLELLDDVQLGLSFT